MAKNNSTQKLIDVETQATLRHRSAWKLTETRKVYLYKIAKIDLNYKLQLLASEYQKHMEVLREKVVVKHFAKFTWNPLYKAFVFTCIIFCYF